MSLLSRDIYPSLLPQNNYQFDENVDTPKVKSDCFNNDNYDGRDGDNMVTTGTDK